MALTNLNSMDEPRHNKSKEEIAAEIKLNYESKRQRKFVKEVLYPWLLANSTSISDAKNLLYAATVAVQQTFHAAVAKEQTRLSEVRLSELHIEDNIKEDEEFKRDRDLLAMFKDEPVATAESLLKGMKLAIESFEREETTKRPLTELQAELLD